MRKASWVLLTVVGVLTLLGSLASVFTAYRGNGGASDAIGRGVSVSDVAAWNPEIATAIRARRGTAAAFAATYSALFLGVVLGPYRRGDRGSWWALLIAAAVLAALTLPRIAALGTRAGVGTALIHFGAVAVALLLDVGRLRAEPGH